MAKKRAETKEEPTPAEVKAIEDAQPQAPAQVACVVCGSAVEPGKACAVDGHVAEAK